MISRKKGILSSEFLVPAFGLLVSVLLVEPYYRIVVEPRVEQIELKQRVMSAQGSTAGGNTELRSIYVIIKDTEQKTEIMFAIWSFIILGYKLYALRRERRVFAHDLLRLQPGERIIPEDSLDRHKELRAAIDREPRWRDLLLPECLLAALHRFHATHSIPDAANAVKERAELAADQLDSSLSLVRYIAWAIPAIGFIGTVRGIGLALAFAEDALKGDIAPVIDALGLAFNSTLVALILSMGLMYFMHVVQSQQEAFIIETQTFCRDKLIDVMKIPARDEAVGSVS
ncbi:MAG: MotA/TolQ/ExbB proton channel family protein [Verrucomicrobia bacterium]|jgi:biopolymer transport protein ExbB/TolQ|nr:MotA/TolQ/ExbB proton channel family protein [Verrucomicrobiota bacterium]